MLLCRMLYLIAMCHFWLVLKATEICERQAAGENLTLTGWKLPAQYFEPRVNPNINILIFIILNPGAVILNWTQVQWPATGAPLATASKVLGRKPASRMEPGSHQRLFPVWKITEIKFSRRMIVIRAGWWGLMEVYPNASLLIRSYPLPASVY